jgi:putative hydrolase of the HAD superfamily
MEKMKNMNRKENKKFTTLFLDIGGVILTNGWGHTSRKLAAEKFHLDITDMDKRYHLAFDTYELGKLSLDEYLEKTVFYEPRPFSMEEFRNFMFSQSKPFPEMIELIKQLKKEHGLKIAVVSNEGRELNEYRIQTFKLAEFVDFFISSCFVHFRKPDIDIFRMALDIAQVDPKEVIYLEDQPMFIKVAESIGIKGIRHISYDNTVEKLRSVGLQLNKNSIKESIKIPM